MTRRIKVLAAAWLAVLLMIFVAPTHGVGDNIELQYWLYIFWTLPFSLLCSISWTYDPCDALPELLEMALVIMLCFSFWFLLIPWVDRTAQRKWDAYRARKKRR